MSFDSKFDSAFEGFDSKMDTAFDGGSTGGGLRSEIDNLRPLGGMDGRFEQAFDRFDQKFEDMDAKFNGITTNATNNITNFSESMFPDMEPPNCSCSDGRFDFHAPDFSHLEFFDDDGCLCDTFDGTSCHKILQPNCGCCLVHCNDRPPRCIVIDARGNKTGEGEVTPDAPSGDIQNLRDQLQDIKNKVGEQTPPQAPPNKPSQFAQFLPLIAQLITTLADAVKKFMKPKEPEGGGGSGGNETPEDSKTVKELKDKITKLEGDKKTKDEEIKKLNDKIEELRKAGGTADEVKKLETERDALKGKIKELDDHITDLRDRLKKAAPGTTLPPRPSTSGTGSPSTPTSPTSPTGPSGTAPVGPSTDPDKRKKHVTDILASLGASLAGGKVKLAGSGEKIDVTLDGTARTLVSFTPNASETKAQNEAKLLTAINNAVKTKLVLPPGGLTLDTVDVKADKIGIKLDFLGAEHPLTPPLSLADALDRTVVEAKMKAEKENVVTKGIEGVDGVKISTGGLDVTGEKVTFEFIKDGTNGVVTDLSYSGKTEAFLVAEAKKLRKDRLEQVVTDDVIPKFTFTPAPTISSINDDGSIALGIGGSSDITARADLTKSKSEIAKELFLDIVYEKMKITSMAAAHDIDESKMSGITVTDGYTIQRNGDTITVKKPATVPADEKSDFFIFASATKSEEIKTSSGSGTFTIPRDFVDASKVRIKLKVKKGTAPEKEMQTELDLTKDSATDL